MEEDDLPSLMFGELTQGQVAELRKSDEPVDLSEEIDFEGDEDEEGEE